MSRIQKIKMVVRTVFALRYRELAVPPDVDVVSFDVFETLLIRPCIHPDDMHEIVGFALGSVVRAISPWEWRNERVEAERSARRLANDLEVTLADIYAVLSRRLGLADIVASRAMDIECDIQTRFTQPIAAARECIAMHRARGKTIAFVSDMYLPTSVIDEVLIRFGMRKPGDVLLVSAEWGRQKRDGTLFDLLAERVNTKPGVITHIGDNPHSDFAMPRRRGLNASLFLGQGLNRYEQMRPSRDNAGPQFPDSAIAGSARSVRLSRRLTTRHEQVIWDVSASVAGPLLGGFVLWVLMRAQNSGLSRLYFLGREGRILSRLARIFAPCFGFNIDTRYFPASPQAFFLPAIDFDDSAFTALIDRMSAGRTLSEIAAYLELPLESLRNAMPSSGRRSERSGDVFNGERSLLLAASLRKSPLRDHVEGVAAARRIEMTSYLDQEGLLDSPPFGIVDVGCQADLQYFLARALQRARPDVLRSMTGLYFSLSRHPPPEAGIAEVFMQNPRYCNAALLRLFCAVDHDFTRTCGMNENSASKAVLPRAANDKAPRWSLSIQQEAIEAFAQQVIAVASATGGKPEQWCNALRQHGRRAFMKFAHKPSIDEAQVYGAFQHAKDESNTLFSEIAPVQGLIGAGRAFLSNSVGETAWPQASLLRSLAAMGLVSLGSLMLQIRAGMLHDRSNENQSGDSAA